MDAETVTLQPVRVLTQHACAIASLQALDGNGDAAVETLLPILEVGRKLEPSSCTLVRSMMARVAQKLALETLVLSSIRRRSRGAEGARRLVAMEYAWGNMCLNPSTLRQFTIGDDISVWTRRCLLPFGPIVFNSRRTINLYSELTAELEKCATGPPRR